MLIIVAVKFLPNYKLVNIYCILVFLMQDNFGSYGHVDPVFSHTICHTQYSLQS